MSEIIAEAILPAETLQAFVDRQLTLVHESKWHFDDEGIHVRAVDPANVAMMWVDLHAGGFESYDSPGEAVVGVNLNAMDDKLSVANSGDLVNVALDMETRMLDIDVRHISQSLALIDPDDIRKEPDLPDIDENMTTEATFTGEVLTEAVDAVDMVTDHLYIESDADEGHVRLYGEGDTDVTEAVFDEKTDGFPFADVDTDSVTLLSMEYVKDILKPIGTDTEVTIEHGDEFPVQFWHDAAEGSIGVHNIIAPRIQTD